jgi:ribosomal protein S18 acetylase RimI-like enzyme
VPLSPNFTLIDKTHLPADLCRSETKNPRQMTIPRRATTDDIRAIATIHRLAFFNAMPHMPVLHTPEEDLAFFSTAVLPNAEIWLTEDSGNMTGFIAFRAGWVDHLYIHPDHQSRGLGSALLALAQASADSLRLWTFQCNPGACRFYERRQFRIERETDGANNEERQPDILYVWTRADPGNEHDA